MALADLLEVGLGVFVDAKERHAVLRTSTTKGDGALVGADLLDDEVKVPVIGLGYPPLRVRIVV